jgi:hypothetical protein
VLASGNRASTYSNHILPSCAACGLLETDAHLFFHCDLPRTVWFTSSLNLRTDSLPHEQDGIQNILQIIINTNTDDTELHAILILLWFIWKARNDQRFNNKTWSPIQVHGAAAAMMANLNASISPTSNNHNHQDSNNDILQQTVHNIQPTVQGMHNLSIMQGHTNQRNH